MARTRSVSGALAWVRCGWGNSGRSGFIVQKRNRPRRAARVAWVSVASARGRATNQGLAADAALAGGVAGAAWVFTSAWVCGVVTGGVAAVAAGEWAPACSSGLTSVGV